MAWLSQFRLGRPNFENYFDLNPNQLQIDEEQISAANRVLSGRQKKWVFRTKVPTIKLSSSWFPKAQRDIISSLLTVSDTFLSFLTRDDWKTFGEINYPSVVTSVPIQENSATLLSQAIVAAGGASIISILGVWTTPPYFDASGSEVNGGDGINYYTGGSYSDSTMTINLGQQLPAVSQVYVDYTYKGWLVDLQKISYTAKAGPVDLFSYDYQLVGV